VATGINNRHPLPQILDPLFPFFFSHGPLNLNPIHNASRLQVFIRLPVPVLFSLSPLLSSALFFLPLVFAVSNLSVSQNLTSGGPVTITWTADSTDPDSCSFELVNEAFHDTFAIANNIPINTGSITVNFPAVPAPYDILLCHSNP